MSNHFVDNLNISPNIVSRIKMMIFVITWLFDLVILDQKNVYE